MRIATFSSLVCAVVTAAITIGSSSALAPRTTTPSIANTSPEAPFMTRRSATLAVIGSAFAVAAPAFAAEDLSSEEKAAIEAQKEKMRKRIEDSKKNYRKTNDLVKDRKETTDYSCLVFKDCPTESTEEKK